MAGRAALRRDARTPHRGGFSLWSTDSGPTGLSSCSTRARQLRLEASRAWGQWLWHTGLGALRMWDLAGCCCCSVTSVVSDSVRPYGQQPSRLLWPQDFPGKNTGMGCNFLLPGSYRTRDQTRVPCLIHCTIREVLKQFFRCPNCSCKLTSASFGGDPSGV